MIFSHGYLAEPFIDIKIWSCFEKHLFKDREREHVSVFNVLFSVPLHKLKYNIEQILRRTGCLKKVADSIFLKYDKMF